MLQIVIYKKLNFWEEYTPLPEWVQTEHRIIFDLRGNLIDSIWWNSWMSVSPICHLIELQSHASLTHNSCIHIPHSLASSFLTLFSWWPNLRCFRVMTSIFERPYRSPHVALVRLLHLSAQTYLLSIPNLLALLPTFHLCMKENI